MTDNVVVTGTSEERIVSVDVANEEFIMESRRDAFTSRYIQTLVDTKEAVLRAGLLALWWTPPDKAAVGKIEWLQDTARNLQLLHKQVMEVHPALAYATAVLDTIEYMQGTSDTVNARLRYYNSFNPATKPT